jgi:hypothetical protein
MESQVIDIESGRVLPWLTAPSFGKPQWMNDGRRVLFSRSGKYYVSDPDLSDAPRPLPVAGNIVDLRPMSDSSSFAGWRSDTMVVVHTDGRAEQRTQSNSGLNAISFDDRWTVEEEGTGVSSVMVARALDGTGRRVVIATGGRFSQAGSAPGVREFIILDLQKMPSVSQPGRTVQRFFSVSYDPTNQAQPFGEPRLLFSAEVADFVGRNYSVGMGGNRFVFKQHISSAPLREVRVIGDWHRRVQSDAKP